MSLEQSIQDLTGAIRRLADALEAAHPENTQAATSTAATVAEITQEAAPPSPFFTHDMVKTRFVTLAAKGHADQLKAILKAGGFASLDAVPKDKLNGLMEAVNRLEQA